MRAKEEPVLPADQDACGNDLTLIRAFLALSPAERLAAWESFANDVLELRRNAHLLAEAPPPDPGRG